MTKSNFWQGFASGALSSLASSLYGGSGFKNAEGNFVQQTRGLNGIIGGGDFGTLAFGTVMGGAGAKLSGGNFWQGAATGLIVSGLNHAMHDDNGYDKNGIKINDNGGDTTDYLYDENLNIIDSRNVFKGEINIYTGKPDGRSFGYKPISGALSDPTLDILGFYGGGKVIGTGLSLLGKGFTAATGGLKQWIRYGTSHSIKGDFATKSFRWGAGGSHWEKIGNPTLQNLNRSFRQTKLPGNNWRVQDAGHFHVKKIN